MSGAGDRRLAVAGAAALLAVALWNIAFLAPVLLPLRLLATFAHETGHGIAALLTGGSFVRFDVGLDGGGVATTIGGWRWLVLPAGYVGAAAMASGLLWAVHRAPQPLRVAQVLAVALALVAVLFGRTSAIALLLGLAMSAGLWLLARTAKQDLVTLVLDVVAFVTGWSSVVGLFTILRSPTVGIGTVLNDAAAFGQHVNVGGGRFWATIWLVVVVAVLVPGVRALLVGSDSEDA